MSRPVRIPSSRGIFALLIMFALCVAPLGGCKDMETLKRELYKKFKLGALKKKEPFEPRDGVTRKSAQLYRSANPNSQIVWELPAETPVRVVDKNGAWYLVQSRDGREGYARTDVIGDEEIIRRLEALRRSIDGLPAQAEGVIKNKANFRLWPGKHHKPMDLLPPGKKVEMYERVVTIKKPQKDRNGPGISAKEQLLQDIRSASDYRTDPVDPAEMEEKKEVWYKIKVEDGRVGYVSTYKLKLTPPADIADIVPGMRLLAWRAFGATDDPDLGAVNNYVAAYAPIGADPGCDFTRVYYYTWDKRNRRRVWLDWQYGSRKAGRLSLRGVLPITDYQYEGRSGFALRRIHPTKDDKLVLIGFVLSRGRALAVAEEEIPDPLELH